jgi:hypothetical protein
MADVREQSAENAKVVASRKKQVTRKTEKDN